MTKRNFSSKHKALIGLAAIKGDKTMAQISSEHHVHPTQIRSMEADFCIQALEEALSRAITKIFNSDQGSQFTAPDFTSRLLSKKIKINMDSRGRYLDNIFTERLWRTVKYENIYLKSYATIPEAKRGLADYFRFYNQRRLHQSLNYQTPAEIYFSH
jgi:putative transposase